MNKMANSTENAVSKEQNKKKKLVLEDFHKQLKMILENDEYDLFQTKSKILLEKLHKNTNIKIQRLLDLKSRSESSIAKITNEIKDLKQSNQVLKEAIIKQLESETV